MTPQINIDIEVTGRKYGNSWLITFIDEAK
jgi:hypothetical protein